MRRLLIVAAGLVLGACASTPDLTPDNASLALRVAKAAMGDQIGGLRDENMNLEAYRRFQRDADLINQGLSLQIASTMTSSALAGAFIGASLLSSIKGNMSANVMTIGFIPLTQAANREQAAQQLQAAMYKHFPRYVSSQYSIAPLTHTRAGKAGNTEYVADGYRMTGPGCPRPDGTLCWLYPSVNKWNVRKGRAPAEIGGFEAWVASGAFVPGLHAHMPHDVLGKEGLPYGVGLPSWMYFFRGSVGVGNAPPVVINADGVHYFVKPGA